MLRRARMCVKPQKAGVKLKPDNVQDRTISVGSPSPPKRSGRNDVDIVELNREIEQVGDKRKR